LSTSTRRASSLAAKNAAHFPRSWYVPSLRSGECRLRTLADVTEQPVEEHGEVREEQLDPEREARRRLALAQIRQYPDPVLRMRANEVESFDDDLRRLVERMTGLMQDANGVGLAGTQVGVVQRVFVLQARPEEEPRAFVNPQIVDRSEEKLADDEGCLSLIGITVPVERPLRVTLAAKDERGDDVSVELEEHAARVAQHELDHLDGVLIIDRTTPEARREALGLLRPEPILGPVG
jgi:peptide deformylase